MNFEKILDQINIAKDVCEYWDVRIEKVVNTDIRFEDYELVASEVKPSQGAFVRVFNNGMWYYASTTDLNRLEDQIKQLAKRSDIYSSHQLDGVAPYNKAPAQFNNLVSEQVRVDLVSMDRKKAVCENYFDTFKSFKNLNNVKINYTDKYKIKSFRSSEDVCFTYDFNQCGLVASYTVLDEKGRFDDAQLYYGKEISELENLKASITEQIEEGLLFTAAKTIEAGEYPVVMDSDVVGVFAHESFGHKSEADFMLGDESAKENWKIGSKVGNECLSIVDVGSEEGTSGYCPIDDEGFPTQKTYLIKDGILTGRLHSQTTSQLLDEAPTGNGRSMSFEFEPIVRMTNTYVEPGDLSLEQLMSKVSKGVFAKGVKHGSGLSTFTIAPRKCYMIRDGKLAEPVKVSVMSGTVFETLNLIDGCSKDFHLESSAFGGCGKGEQWPLPVGDGGPKVLVQKLMLS